MFFPVRTDRRNKRPPLVNYALIAANVLIFLLTYRQVQTFGPALVRGYTLEQIWAGLPVIRCYLWPDKPALYQFLTYQFLHQDWMHLLGNMIFLWVFGNSVEDRLGRVGYLAFYLAAGVVAGIAHSLPADAGPVLGASGAVAGVTGAFLALFPLTEITLVFIFGGGFVVSSLVLILFRIAQDIVFEWFDIGHVAYTAHLAGYGYGFLLMFGLLVTGLLPRDRHDMLSVLEHRRRKWEFQRLARGGAAPWDYAKPGEPPAPGDAGELTPEQRAIVDRRAAINSALLGQDVTEAARLYADLLRDDPRQVMSQQAQLDIANQLMSEGRYDLAAQAYELMLACYPAYGERHQVALILGLIYARYLKRRDRAKELLREALPGLNRDDKQLAEQVLMEVG